MTAKTRDDAATYDEQIFDGADAEGGAGGVWQDTEAKVVWDPAEDPMALDVPQDDSSTKVDPFIGYEGDPDSRTAQVPAGNNSDAALYDDARATASKAASPGSTPEDQTASPDMPPEECTGEVVDRALR